MQKKGELMQVDEKCTIDNIDEQIQRLDEIHINIKNMKADTVNIKSLIQLQEEASLLAINIKEFIEASAKQIEKNSEKF